VVPPLVLKIEHGKNVGSANLPGLADRIRTSLHNSIKIRPEIKFVEPGSLPRETRKTPVFEKAYQDG